MPALLETLAYFNSSLLFTLGSGGALDGRAQRIEMDVQEDDLKRLSAASWTRVTDAARSATHNHSCSDADDINDDGVLTLGDAVYLFQYMFTGGAPIPGSDGSCGPDQTGDDDLDCMEFGFCG